MESLPPSPDPDHSHAVAGELMIRVQQGDRAAFEALYDLLADTVFSVAMKYSGSESAARDIMQEVFCRVWGSARLYDARFGRVAAWVVTMTRNASLNRLRSEERMSSAHQRMAQQSVTAMEDSGALQVLVQEETAAAVRSSLEALPSDQAEAIRMAFFQNMTHESAAATLNVPLGTLKARIRRGLLRLQEQLQFIR